MASVDGPHRSILGDTYHGSFFMALVTSVEPLCTGGVATRVLTRRREFSFGEFGIRDNQQAWFVEILNHHDSNSATVNFGLTALVRRIPARWRIRVVDADNNERFTTLYENLERPHVFRRREKNAPLRTIPFGLLNCKKRRRHDTLSSCMLKVDIEFTINVPVGVDHALAMPKVSRIACSGLTNLSVAAMSRLSALHASGTGTDFVIVSSDAKEFPVHRAILMAHSPVFAAMMSKECKETLEGRCVIADGDSETVELILKYLYSCCVDGIDAKAEKVVELADKYDVADLKKLCEEKLMGKITVETAAKLIIMSDMRKLRNLYKAVLEFLIGNMVGFIDAGGLAEIAAYDTNLLTRVVRLGFVSSKRSFAQVSK